MLLGWKIKAALTLAVLLIVAGAYFYVDHLQGKVAGLQTENVELKDDNKELATTIEQQKQFDEVIVKLDELSQPQRVIIRNERDNDLKRIDEKVRAGQDRPVGPLLKDFLNGK